MILQPLLENAVKYGVYESLEPVHIKLSILREDHFLRISISNPVEVESGHKAGKGVGLKNVQERMQLLGQAPEGMQIRDAKLGGIFNMGGAAVANYVSLLEPAK